MALAKMPKNGGPVQRRRNQNQQMKQIRLLASKMSNAAAPRKSKNFGSKNDPYGGK